MQRSQWRVAFALAPYRVAQSTGHLLGPISLFLPLSLLALEKRRPLLAALAIAAIPLSGQVSLALGAVPLFVAYAFVRGRGLRDALPGTLLGIGAAELVQAFAIRGSLHEQGRSLAEVDRYSANWSGFLFAARERRDVRLPRLADAAARARRLGVDRSLAPLRTCLAAGCRGARAGVARVGDEPADVPARTARDSAPRRVASSGAAAADRVPRARRARGVRARAFAKQHSVTWRRSRPDRCRPARAHVPRDGRRRGNTAYAGLRSAPPGRLLDLPVFLPDVHLNSTYLYYDQSARAAGAPRATDRDPAPPRKADVTARALRALNCGGWSPELRSSGFRYVAVHQVSIRARPDVSNAADRRCTKSRLPKDRSRRSDHLFLSVKRQLQPNAQSRIGLVYSLRTQVHQRRGHRVCCDRDDTPALHPAAAHP